MASLRDRPLRQRDLQHTEDGAHQQGAHNSALSALQRLLFLAQQRFQHPEICVENAVLVLVAIVGHAFGDLLPERHGLLLDFSPFRVGDGAELQLAAVDAQVGLAAPVPVLAVVVRRVHREPEERLQVIGQLVPAFGVREVGADPRAGERVREEVLAGIGPADGVVLRDARPRDAVQRARAERHLGVLVGERDRHDAELAEEAARRREGVDLQTLEVGKVVDGLLRREVAGIPRTGGKPCHLAARSLLVRLGPDLVEAVLREEDRHVERVARGEREVAAEDAHVGRRGHRVVVGLHETMKMIKWRFQTSDCTPSIVPACRALKSSDVGTSWSA